MEEFSANGSIIQTTRFGAAPPTLSYRAFKQAWVGCPKSPPAIYVDTRVDNAVNMTIYISWNGATEYNGWVIRGGSVNGSMDLVERVPKSGFETSVSIPRTPRVQVQAVMNSRACGYRNGESYSPIVEVN